jgi:hypothetical protein
MTILSLALKPYRPRRDDGENQRSLDFGSDIPLRHARTPPADPFCRQI